MRYIILLIYLILTTCGLIFMKLGGNPGSIVIRDGNVNMGINLISGIGFACYIISFLLFTRIVLIFNLSYIFPLCTGIVQVAILISSYYIFKEKISVYGIVGASFIILGIIIMSIKLDKDEIKKTTVNNAKQEMNINLNK